MLPLVFQINWILTFNHCKIPDVLSKIIQAKTYFYLQKNVLEHTRLLRWFASIGLMPTVAITIKLELQTNTYIYKIKMLPLVFWRFNAFLLQSLQNSIPDVLSPHIMGFFFIFKIARGYKQKLTFYLQNFFFSQNLHNFEMKSLDLLGTLPLKSSQNYKFIHIYIKD